MHTTDYSSPERQASGPATRATDDFALAVLVYQLLTAGNHPFGGVPHDSASESTVKDNIAASCSYVVRPERVVIPRGTIDPSVLPPNSSPWPAPPSAPACTPPPPAPGGGLAARPQQGALLVRVCQNRPLHAYGSHLTSCPWCTRAAVTGHDVFNGPVPVPVPDAPPQGKTGGAWSKALKIALVIAVVVILVIIAVQGSGG